MLGLIISAHKGTTHTHYAGMRPNSGTT